MKKPLSSYQAFFADPKSFRFDAALRLLSRALRRTDIAHVARFRGATNLAYRPSEIEGADPPAGGKPPNVSVGTIGLTGAAGVLPRLYTEALTASLRNRSRAMADFLDLVAQRFVAGFGTAGYKYRLHRAAEQAAIANETDSISDAVLALTGYGTPHLSPRLAVGVMPLLHYAGFFAAHPRSADRLAALLTDWLGREVAVEQFSGAWLALPPDQRSKMPLGRRPGQFNQLGIDAAIGTRAWDPQARIVLRIGPLDRASFEAMLPDRPLMKKLASLVRAYVGHEVGFAINPVLARPDVPQLHLTADASAPPRLGWNCWAPPPLPPVGLVLGHADDAVFEAEIIETTASRER